MMPSPAPSHVITRAPLITRFMPRKPTQSRGVGRAAPDDRSLNNRSTQVPEITQARQLLFGKVMLKSLTVLVLSIAASSCVDLEVRREASTLPAPRPDAAPAAPTAATTITVTVDETGGTVELLGGPRLVIPAGSLDGAHEISITQLGDRYPVGGISPAFTFSP